MLRRLGRDTWAVGAIVVAQGTWLAVLMGRGWFYQDDLAFLAQAHEQGLSGSYLTRAVNDHLVPGLRLVFWLMAPLGATNYWVTIVVRVILQAAATWLLYLLLVRLVGRRPAVVRVVAAYALSPLLLGMLWLTVAVDVLPAQVFVLLALHSFVSFVRGGTLRHAAGAGLAFAAAASFWELSAVDAILLVPLSLGFLYSGRFGERVRAALRQWRGWLLIVLPIGGYLAAFILGGYGRSASSPGTGNLARSWWVAWAHTVAPMALGGPWKWFAIGPVYYSATNPTNAAVWTFQVIVVVLVALSVWRTGLRALVAWSLPLIEVVVASSLVAVGRFGAFGLLSARTINYAFDATVPLAIGVTLAFAGPRTRPGPAHHHATARLVPVTAWLCAATALAGAVLSDVRFADRWQQNPTRSYLSTLRAEFRAHQGVSVFDTTLPPSVLPFIDANRYLSDIVPLLHVPADVNSDGPHPLLADAHGHLIGATFIGAAAVAIPPDKFCGDLYAGLRSRTHALSRRPGTNAWFLRLKYFQQHPNAIDVTLIDKFGREVAPVTGRRVLLRQQLSTQFVRFPSFDPVAIRISTDSPGANVCLTAIQIGSPFPASH